MSRLSDAIKSALSMDDVVRFYGYKPNQSSFIKCPFHSDKTASLKVYPEPGRGFHCYGCHQGGSVIDFAMQLFNIDFAAACVRLNADFRLGLSDDRPDPAELAQLRRARHEAEQKRAEFEAEYATQCELHRRLWAAKQAGPEHPDYAEACKKLDALDWWFQEHPYKQR